MARKEFSEKDKIKMLLWCDRHCCLCGKQCGGGIEIHHIENEEDNGIENGIPLCFECHGHIEAHKKSPKGSKFKPEELKTRRDQIYDKYTAYLVPVLQFEITQRVGLLERKFPNIGFHILHTGGAFPIRVKVVLKVYLGNKLIQDFSQGKNYYGGTKDWHLNPGNGVNGHFYVSQRAIRSKKQLKVRVEIKIIDNYTHEHKLEPAEYICLRDKNAWYLEP